LKMNPNAHHRYACSQQASVHFSSNSQPRSLFDAKFLTFLVGLTSTRELVSVDDASTGALMSAKRNIRGWKVAHGQIQPGHPMQSYHTDQCSELWTDSSEDDVLDHR